MRSRGIRKIMTMKTRSTKKKITTRKPTTTTRTKTKTTIPYWVRDPATIERSSLSNYLAGISIIVRFPP